MKTVNLVKFLRTGKNNRVANRHDTLCSWVVNKLNNGPSFDGLDDASFGVRIALV